MNDGLVERLENAESQLDTSCVTPNPFSQGEDSIAFCSEDILIWNSQIDAIEEGFGIKASCTAGCGYCCHQLISVAESELIPLKEYMKSFDRDTLQDILTKSELICNTLLEYGCLCESLSEGVIQEEVDYDRLIEEYYKLHLYCPFLDEEKKCRVYPVRPGVCWAYRSYADPALCARPEGSYGCVCYSGIADAYSERLREFHGLEEEEIMIFPFSVRNLLRELL